MAGSFSTKRSHAAASSHSTRPRLAAPASNSAIAPSAPRSQRARSSAHGSHEQRVAVQHQRRAVDVRGARARARRRCRAAPAPRNDVERQRAAVAERSRTWSAPCPSTAPRRARRGGEPLELARRNGGRERRERLRQIAELRAQRVPRPPREDERLHALRPEVVAAAQRIVGARAERAIISPSSPSGSNWMPTSPSPRRTA
jgi:hypothetical protein